VDGVCEEPVGGKLGKGLDLAGVWLYYAYMRLVETIGHIYRRIGRGRYVERKLRVILMEMGLDGKGRI